MKNIYCKIYLDSTYPLIIPYSDLESFLVEEFREVGNLEDVERYKIEFILLTDLEYEELEEHKGW